MLKWKQHINSLIRSSVQTGAVRFLVSVYDLTVQGISPVVNEQCATNSIVDPTGTVFYSPKHYYFIYADWSPELGEYLSLVDLGVAGEFNRSIFVDLTRGPDLIDIRTSIGKFQGKLVFIARTSLHGYGSLAPWRYFNFSPNKSARTLLDRWFPIHFAPSTSLLTSRPNFDR